MKKKKKRGEKMTKVEYKNLHKLMKNGKQMIAHNVSCGLVKYGGKRIIGCGKRATLDSPNYGYYYKTNGCFSSVYLCEKCKKKVGKRDK